MSDIQTVTRERDAYKAALKLALDACDKGRLRPGCGAGGMTIESNIRGSIYTGVPAWPIEEARNVFYDPTHEVQP